MKRVTILFAVFLVMMCHAFIISAQQLKKGDKFTYTTVEGEEKAYVVTSENLIDNPSFDNGDDGWIGGGGGSLTGVDWHSNGGVDGGAYLRLTEHFGKGGNGSIGMAWPIEKGKLYVFSYYIRQYSSTEAVAEEFYINTSETNIPRGDESKILMRAHENADCAWTQNIVVTTAEYNYLQFSARWLGGSYCFDAFILAEVSEIATPKELEQLLNECEEWLNVYEVPQGEEVFAEVIESGYNMLSTFDNYTQSEVNNMIKELENALFDYQMANVNNEHPLDVTNHYLTNPTMRENAQGWSGSQPNLEYEVMEFYNCDFDMCQQLTDVPNGKYKVYVQGFYRTDGNDGGAAYQAGTENITAELYANDVSVPMLSLYKYPASVMGITNDQVWNDYVNMRVSTNEAFNLINPELDMPYYAENELTVFVSDGTLKIGLRNSGSSSSSWCAFRDFRLEYYGNLIQTQKATTPQSEVIYEEGTAKVILTTSTEGAVIYYTLDGSTPTTSSTLYNGAFYVKDNCLLKAMAVCDGYNDSELLECNIFVNTLEVESPWVGATLNDGLSAYLYNPKAKAFLGAGNAWGTQASFVSKGVEWLVSGSDGVYALSGSISNGGENHYFDGLWNDASATGFEIEMVGADLYTMKLNGSYVAYCGTTIVDTIAELTDGCYWQFVTKEERRSKYAEATDTEPVNATFEILGANFGRNDTNNSAWSGSPIFGGSNDNFCAEKWNAGVVEVSQVLRNMPSGKYRLRVQGFYRMGSMENVTAARTNGTEVLYAQFFANDVSVPVMSVLDEAGKLEGIGNSGYGDYGLAPNSMSEASQFFSAGLYEHSFLFALGGGVDTIRLGVEKTGYVDADWVIFDNFRLEYLGEGNESDFFTNGILTSMDEGPHYVFYTDTEGKRHYLYAAGQNDWAVSDSPVTIEFSAGNTTEEPFASAASFMASNGFYMSNAANSDGSGVIKTEVITGINGSNKRTWESQVFYKNAKGKHAIRLTNSKGTSWGANCFVNIDSATLAVVSGQPSLGDALYLWEIADEDDSRFTPEALNALIEAAEALDGACNKAVKAELDAAVAAAKKATTEQVPAIKAALEAAIEAVETSIADYAAIVKEVAACEPFMIEGATGYDDFAEGVELATSLVEGGDATAETLAELREAKATFLAANEVADALVNGTFGDAFAASVGGWTQEGGEMGKTGNHNKWTNVNDGFFEQWQNTLPDVEIYQEISGLPAGTYTFAAYVVACQQSNDDSHEVSGVNLFANSDSVAIHTINVDRNAANQAIGAELALVTTTIAEGETLKVGMSVKSTDANWIVIDNAKLYSFFIPKEYTLTYILDGDIYKTCTYEEGMTIIPEDEPIKEGYTFSGWSEIPSTMPSHDVTVTGVYVLNATQTDAQGVVYSLDASGNAFTITGYTSFLSVDVVVPASLYNVPVTSVNAQAFMGAMNMESITLPTSVTSVGDRVFYGCDNLLVIEWNTMASVRAECFGKSTNYGNMLVYVANANTPVSYKGNVVVEGAADEITLDREFPFRNTREFTARHISYTHEFTKQTRIGESGGWEALVLPFDVQTVTSEEKGVLLPFGKADFTTSLPYWVAELQSNGTFAYVDAIRANTPFIMEVPNSDEYEEMYNIKGNVTFSAENVVVHATTSMPEPSGSNYALVGCYEGMESGSRVYALNDEEYTADGIGYMPGGVFVSGDRDIRPFEAYVYSNSAARAPYLRISGRDGTGLVPAVIGTTDDGWYTLQGIRLNGKPTDKGVYIINRKKVIID